MRQILPLIFLFLSLNSNILHGKTLTVAVASNFYPTLKKLAHFYEQESDNNIRLVSASSGKLYAQIVNGAPFDMFFSADEFRINALIKNGLVNKLHQKVYANGKLALWSKTKNNCFKALKNNDFHFLAIANPKTAPYGRAAKQTLEKIQLWGKAKQLIYGENIAQTVHFVESGNAQLGLVAYSLVKHNQKSQCVILINPENYAPIAQRVAISKNTKQENLAIEFYRFISSEKAKNIIKTSGYDI